MSAHEVAQSVPVSPPTLLDLAERCEKATGPDRDLDVAIGLTGKFYVAEPRYPGAEPMIGYVDENGSRVEPGNGAADNLVPRYTASLDAAMTLAPGPDWEWAIEWESGTLPYHLDVEMHARAKIGDPALYMEAEALTPALALTAAALRARARFPAIAMDARQGTDPKGLDGEAATARASSEASPKPSRKEGP